MNNTRKVTKDVDQFKVYNLNNEPTKKLKVIYAFPFLSKQSDFVFKLIQKPNDEKLQNTEKNVSAIKINMLN